MPQLELPFQSENDICNIIPVSKRRDGGTRYWCIKHKADATAKYGTKGEKCRYADIPSIEEKEILSLDLQDYPGGVGLWGAVPPVFDTTSKALDRGIHVHARKEDDGKKVIDRTFRKIQVCNANQVLEISELDAIYYMVSTIFGFKVKLIHCTRCGYPHLDKDWFSVHPHQSHLCSGCGKNFRDTHTAIGNPIAAIQEYSFSEKQKTQPSKKRLRLNQKDYPGGIQLWGSNPSILWTSKKFQESGIHVHAFTNDNDEPEIDDTFSSLEIDGIQLDEDQVRTYMAQSSLPHLANRTKSIVCTNCETEHFDSKHDAFNPTATRYCVNCKIPLQAAGKLKKVIANPAVNIMEKISKFSPRTPQKHDLGLLPETI